MSPGPIRRSRFQDLLAGFDLDLLQRASGTVFGLWPDFSLAYFNDAWLRFAEQNGGEPQVSQEWPIGRSVFDAIPAPLQAFFDRNYHRCLREQRPWEHLYECSSADVYRLFHMTAFPLGGSAGILVVNSLRRETAHRRIPYPPMADLFCSKEGVVTQCCHCRRVRRVDDPQNWEWVPEWVKVSPPQTSHGLCPSCMGYYYSDERADDDGLAFPFRTSRDTE